VLKNAPFWTIVVCAVVGLWVDGWAGAAIGGVGGVVLVTLLGIVVRATQGGLLPRNVRRKVVTNLLRERRGVVADAHPGLDGGALHRAVDDDVEVLARRAVDIAAGPNHGDIWTPNNMAAACTTMLAERRDARTVNLYLAVLSQIHKDWSPHSPAVQRLYEMGETNDIGFEEFALATELQTANATWRLRVGTSHLGPTLEVVPDSADFRLGTPLVCISTGRGPARGRMVMVSLQPFVDPLVSSLLLARGFAASPQAESAATYVKQTA
jgi:hypothetical protein